MPTAEGNTDSLRESTRRRSSSWTLIQSSTIPLDNPAGRPLVPPRATPLACDRFTGGNAADINGRALDNGFGGIGGLVWSRNVANAFAIAAGALVRGTDPTSARATIPIANGDVEAGFPITAVPAAAGQSLFMDVRLNADASSSASRSAYRLQLTLNNGVPTVQLQRRAGGGTSIGSARQVKIGDIVAIRAVGGKEILLVNNYEVETYTAPTPLADGTHFGFESGTNALFGIDDLYVEQILG